jgi:hypothetical protein
MQNFFLKLNYQQQFLWLTLLLAPLLLGAGDSYQKYQDEISQMTQAERDHLQHNFATYKHASSEVKHQVEQFHQALEADRLKGGSLQITLNEYMDWLNTISTFDRATLRDEKDAAKRVTLVEQILMKRETSNPIIRMIPQLLSQSPGSFKTFERFLFGHSISMIELDRVIDRLKNNMPTELPIEFQDVRSLRGSDKVVKVLRWYTLAQPDSKGIWVNDILLEDIKKIVQDKDVLKWVNERGPSESKFIMLHTILRSAVFYEIEEMARSKKLSPDSYQSILKKSDDKMRMYLSSLPASEINQFLSNFAVIQDFREQKIKLKSVQLLEEVGKKYFSSRPEMFRRPGGGPPPDGRGSEGRDANGEGRPPFSGDRPRGGPRPFMPEIFKSDKPDKSDSESK